MKLRQLCQFLVSQLTLRGVLGAAPGEELSGVEEMSLPCTTRGAWDGERPRALRGKLSGPGRREGDSSEPGHVALSPKAGTEQRMGRCDDQQSIESWS